MGRNSRFTAMVVCLLVLIAVVPAVQPGVTRAAMQADAFVFPFEPDGGKRPPKTASYDQKNPYLKDKDGKDLLSECYDKSMTQLQHAGEDWFRPVGTEVHPIANGRVVYLSWWDHGDAIVIEHTLPAGWRNPWGGDTIYSVYLHLTAKVKLDQDVTREQVIGYVNWHPGNSHLHLEVRQHADMSGILKCPASKETSYIGPSYTDAGVSPDTFGYTNPQYWISSHRHYEDQYPPAAPTNLRATALDSSRIRLDWNDNSDNESGFYIYSDSEQSATVDASTTTYTEGNLAPGSSHCYILYAFNDQGASDWSDWACATTPRESRPTNGELRVVEVLTLSTTNPQVGQGVRARFKIKNVGGQAMRLQELAVGARRGSDWSGEWADFPHVYNITLQPNQEYVYEQTRSFTNAGNYFAEQVVKINGNWGGVGGSNRVNFTVQAVVNCPNQYRAEYYNNRSLSGSPAFVRCEGWPINQNWGDGGPGNGVASDGFSVRWTGRAYLAAGNYTFILRADDGMQIYLNGRHWRASNGHSEQRFNATFNNSGEHEFKVEYYENGGAAIAQFRWEQQR